MDSALPVETIAMNSMTRIKAEPTVPINSVATAGGTKPAPASAALIGSCNAVEARPKHVAKEKGMANQQILNTTRA
jgi:hypothetical protein